ncbi:MAG: AraC family transcriptional regulator [Clostridia bacterium]|nr:AraC family transcriptional regulator [Clostridia bacterium]
MKNNNEHFSGIKPFDIMIKYIDIDATSPENVFDSHIHEECEIYINISGNVSFIVENNIYPVVPGSIIITRPFEYHHCVYHSNERHKHFWILFSCLGNEHLFDIFFKRKAGEKNLIMLPADKTEDLIDVCHKMTEESTSETEKYFRFFKLLTLLNDADIISHIDTSYPNDIVHAINYINNNLSDNISVSELAKKLSVSVNTLERHFMQMLNISPSSYIRKKRLANAVKLLSQGCTVTEASEKSGFTDYSKFISLFKKTYGMTPLKYKKSLSSSAPL